MDLIELEDGVDQSGIDLIDLDDELIYDQEVEVEVEEDVENVDDDNKDEEMEGLSDRSIRRDDHFEDLEGNRIDENDEVEGHASLSTTVSTAANAVDAREKYARRRQHESLDVDAVVILWNRLKDIRPPSPTRTIAEVKAEFDQGCTDLRNLHESLVIPGWLGHLMLMDILNLAFPSATMIHIEKWKRTQDSTTFIHRPVATDNGAYHNEEELRRQSRGQGSDQHDNLPEGDEAIERRMLNAAYRRSKEEGLTRTQRRRMHAENTWKKVLKRIQKVREGGELNRREETGLSVWVQEAERLMTKLSNESEGDRMKQVVKEVEDLMAQISQVTKSKKGKGEEEEKQEGSGRRAKKEQVRVDQATRVEALAIARPLGAASLPPLHGLLPSSQRLETNAGRRNRRR